MLAIFTNLNDHQNKNMHYKKMANHYYVVVSVPYRPELNTYFAAKEASVVQKPQVLVSSLHPQLLS